MELNSTIVMLLIQSTGQTIKGMIEVIPALLKLKSAISLFTIQGVSGMCIGVPTFIVSVGIKFCRKALKY